MLLGAVIGAAISVATTVVSDAVQHKAPSFGEIAQSAVVGAVSGAVSGLAGPEAGPVAKMAVGALSSGAGQMVSNAMSGKPLMDGVGQAALIGGVTGGLMEGGGAEAESAASDAEGAVSEAGEACGLSFRADTPVATLKGEQAIGTLEVGEKVWAYNPQTKKVELEPIQHLWLNHDNDLVDLTLTATIKGSDGKTTQKNELIHTNERHPFLTKEKGFIPVSQLKPGMHVRQADGNYGVVAKLVVVPGAMWMYNLTIAQDHTYVVGLEQWIVHNVCTRTSGPGHYLIGSYKDVREAIEDDPSLAGYQSHHIYQDAMMQSLPGYSRDEAPAIALFGGSSIRGSAHDWANVIQNNVAGGLRFLRAQGLSSVVDFDTATQLAEGGLSLAGVGGQDLADAMDSATNYFTSNFSPGALNNLRIPGGFGYWRLR